MQIVLNGEDTELEEGANLAQLLEQRGFSGRRLAVEVNGEIVPRSEYEHHRLEPADRVEVVHAIGGGAGDPGAGVSACESRAWS